MWRARRGSARQGKDSARRSGGAAGGRTARALTACAAHAFLPPAPSYQLAGRRHRQYQIKRWLAYMLLRVLTVVEAVGRNMLCKRFNRCEAAPATTPDDTCLIEPLSQLCECMAWLLPAARSVPVCCAWLRACAWLHTRDGAWSCSGSQQVLWRQRPPCCSSLAQQASLVFVATAARRARWQSSFGIA